MKKIVCLLLAAALALGLTACSGAAPAAAGPGEAPAAPTAEPAVEPDYRYVICVYTDSCDGDRARWLTHEALAAGFTIRIENGGDVLAAAGENGDGDVLLGLDDARWDRLVRGGCDGLTVADWTPSWAEAVGEYRLEEKAWGISREALVMLCRTDEAGTGGAVPELDHWADVADSGYAWYCPPEPDSGLLAALLCPYTDPRSAAGGISLEGWQALWRFCAEGVSGTDADGREPLRRGDVQLGVCSTAALRGEADAETWAIADIADGAWVECGYLGILERDGRTEAQDAVVAEFADWLGTEEIRAAWGEEFGVFPCHREAAAELYPEGIPAGYALPGIALRTVAGTDMSCAAYAAAHGGEWANILDNLGFLRGADEPDWEALAWDELVTAAEEEAEE